MTREEAMRILELYRHWNPGQTSSIKLMTGTPTDEDRVYDERRATIKEAYRVLRSGSSEVTP